jgi:DNA sulfur modification protein DndD
MIRRLFLTEYGRFKGVSFDMGPVTVFHGDNESGKTTVFDALAECLGEPLDGRSALGKPLRTRYGDGRRCDLERDGDTPVRIPMDELLGLYAVKNGSVDFAPRNDADWLQRVKSNLFTDGANPGEAKEQLERLASENGSYAHNKEKQKLEGELSEARQCLAGQAARRDAVVGHERSLVDLSQRVALARARAALARARQGELDARRDEQLAIARRRRLEEIAALLAEQEKQDREIASNRSFAEDRLGDYDAIAGRVADLARQQARSAEAAAQRAARMEELRGEREVAASGAGLAGQTLRVCGQLLDRISDFMREPVVKQSSMWRPGLLAAAIATLVAGIAAAVLVHDTAARVATAGMGLAIAMVLTLLARTAVSVVDEGRRDEFVKRLVDEWTNARLGADASGVRTLPGLQEFLLVRKTEAARAGDEVARLDDAIDSMRAEQARDADEASRLDREREAAEAESRSWLRGLEVADRDEYVRAIARYQQLESARADRASKVADLCQEAQCASATELERDVRNKLAVLDEQGVPRVGLLAAEARRLEAQAGDARREAESAAAEVARLEKEEGETRGLVRGSLGDLPESMVAQERRVAHLGKAIAARVLDRQAAGLAASLFAGICDDADRVFGELEDAIRTELADVLGPDREVKVSGFGADAMQVEDATGAPRGTELLSGGTRDCFVLAARLALARRAGWKNGVLVLDEPFLRIDAARRARALGMIRRFREQTGWQVVLFTMDEGLAQDAKRVFGDKEIVEHLLSA